MRRAAAAAAAALRRAAASAAPRAAPRAAPGTAGRCAAPAAPQGGPGRTRGVSSTPFAASPLSLSVEERAEVLRLSHVRTLRDVLSARRPRNCAWIFRA